MWHTTWKLHLSNTIKQTATYFKTRVSSLIACTATSYSLSRVMETIRSCANGEMTDPMSNFIKSITLVSESNPLSSIKKMYLFSPVPVVVQQSPTIKLELLCKCCPAGGANLEATGEEFQSCIEFSVIVETLQSCQTLQAYLALLE